MTRENSPPFDPFDQFDTPTGGGSPAEVAAAKEEKSMNISIGELQSDEHRRVLDVVAQLRKCGLESLLSLPQIVRMFSLSLFPTFDFHNSLTMYLGGLR